MDAAIKSDHHGVYSYETDVYIHDNGNFSCYECIFRGIVGKCAWKKHKLELDVGLAVTGKQTFERHYDGEMHNPHIKEYKVFLDV